jgi:N-acetylneuraminic acid mutarotase
MSGANVPTSLGGYYDRTAWTGTEMIVWSGSGARYDPITDTWAPMAADGSGYQSVSSVWTGQEFIVCYSIACRRYKPANDTWSSTSNPVSAMYGGQTAVWTGSEMIVFGGRDSTTSKNTGGRYNPQTDTWSAMPTAGAPARAYHTAVWTGTQMIVWGGYESGTQEPELGARYTPATNQWTPLPTSTSPEGRHEHTAVWTGSEMIVWGGRSRETFPEKVFADGGRYDPVNDSWTPIPSLGAASSRYAHSAVWDGARMIVYGGQGPSNLGYRVDGSRYDLASGAWTPVSLGGAPVPRKAFATVWTGSEMIVWGGEEAFPPGQMLNTGARYDPLIDQWTAMSVGAAPQPRKSSSMVWTGTEAIVLGGLLGPGDSNPTSTGGRYSPASDSWAPTSNAGAPSPGSVIWSGSEAIVWNGYTSTGGRYDPSVDQWRPISSSGAPQSASTAVVWTDHEMIVWGGDDVFGGDDGGRYNPASDTWAAVTALGPSPRTPAAASWNGYEMLIWGGYVWLTTDRRQNLYDGGRYNPPTGTWSMVPTQGAPSTGEYMTTVALGREFLVWGPDGYRYAPDVAAPWRAMAAPAVPPPSSAHIVWTGEVALFWDGLYRRGAMYAVDSDHDGDSNACDADDDDDGTPDVSDCAPLDEAAVIEPAEVEDVVMSKMSPNVRFDWTAQPGMSYGLIAGYLSHLAADGSVARADCMLPSTPTNSWSGFLSPASPGDGLYFLVRARNACGVGTYGAATSGNLHISDADCP